MLWWILLWVLLVLGAVALLGWLAYRLLRQGLAFGRQLGESAGQVADALAGSHEPYRPAASALTEPVQTGPGRSRPGAGPAPDARA